MNVFGDGGEDITFMAYDKTSEQYYTVAEHVTFVADNSGSWFAPMKLTLGSEATGISQLNRDLLVDAAGNHLTINAGGKYINRVTLTNMGGVTVMSLSDIGTGATITTKSLADGMYIVTIQAEGKTYYEKILKTNK
jgi:tRNA G18 (ribose-2'-O)-methylase SpoU